MRRSPFRRRAATALMMAALMWASAPSGATPQDTGKPRSVPFPAGTYVANVAWPVPPTVKAEADRFVVELRTADRGPLTCIVSGARELAERSVVALARGRADLSDLSRAVITELSVSPQLPVVFMTLQRTKTTSTGLAAFRDAETSFLCLNAMAADPAVFRRVVTELATSIHPARRTTDVALVRLCRLRLQDGSVGFERWQVSKRGREMIGSVTSSLAYRTHDGVDFMELDAVEAIDPSARIKDSTLIRMEGGKPHLRSTIRHRDGASYEYDVVTAAGATSGRFRTKSATGLDSSIAITKRISGDLIGGRAPTFAVEIWDPFSPQKEPSQVVYSLESRAPPTVDVAQGARHSRQILDDNGFTRRAETTLSGNEKLVSECETQRGAL